MSDSGKINFIHSANGINLAQVSFLSEMLNFLLRENLNLVCTEGELVDIDMFWQLSPLFLRHAISE